MSFESRQTLLLFFAISGTIVFVWYIYQQKSSFPILYYASSSRILHNASSSPILYNASSSQRKTSSETFVLDSGWDERAFALFRQTFQKINDNKMTRIVTFPIGGLTARVIDIDSGFWDLVEKGNWERNTYDAFMQYIASDTTVIDIGTWIGPTILFNSQIAARTYAIEADPVAFAKASYNLKLNAQTPWYNRVHLQAGCVGVESRLLEMKSLAAGNSMSSFHKFSSETNDSVTMKWTVHCYSLSAMFEAWQIHPEIAHVLVKIDIESYECQVLPSLYSWLANMKRKPTLYVAMHSQITACTNDQYAQIAKLAALYRFRSSTFIDEKGNVKGSGEYVLSDVMAPA